MPCADAAGFGFAKTENCSLQVPVVLAVGKPPEIDFPTVEYEWFFWLSVVTAALCVALAIPRVILLSRRQTVALSSQLRAPSISLAAKLIASTAFAGLRIGLLVVAIRHPQTSARLVASTALDFTAACLVIALSPLEHFKSRRPSILVCSFLFLTLIYDVTRCPSLWPAPTTTHDATFAALFTATVIVEFAFLVAESTRPSRWIAGNQDADVDAADRSQSPEETSSILSLGLYAWLNPLLWRGYHEPLHMRHLYPLDRSISVAHFDVQHSGSGSQSKPPDRDPTNPSTWEVLLWLSNSKPLVRSVLLPVLPRLCLIGFTFCQPFFLQRLLRFLSSTVDTSPGNTSASSFISVAVLIYSGLAISTALYWYYLERFQSLLRAFLISAIYRKTAHIRHVGEGDQAAITLMGTDVERIYTGVRLVQELWADVIQIALAAWLLQRELGLAFLAPLVVVVLGFAFSFAISRRAVSYQAAWMARVQARISATSSVLSKIKDLRVSGMTQPATALVQREREDEINVGERSRVLVAISASFSSVPQAVAPALAFAFGPKVLDQTRAFTALSYLALLTSPLLVVLQSVPIVAACFACLTRIKVFVNQQERPAGVLDAADKPDVDARRAHADPDQYIVVRKANFGWSPDKCTLTDIDLCLPRSSITFVVGPVASGKSTLCRALLKEAHQIQGTVTLGSKKLGYCDQVPFLFNGSVVGNIVGFSSFDTARYTEVIGATLLGQDLGELPFGDQTIIGSKGISLSGGQRQRISLARALYHDADILLLDDVFSGLDGSTQTRVCRALFGLDGLLRRRGTTVILCTHSTRFLPVADYIVSLSAHGTIADQGSVLEFARHELRAQHVGFVRSQALNTNTILSSNAPDVDADDHLSPKQSSDEILPPRRPVIPGAAGSKIPSSPVDMDLYRQWLSTLGLLPVIGFLILAAGMGFSSNFTTIWLKMWSADSTTPSPKHSFGFWVGIYSLIGAGAVICVLPASLIMLRTGVRLGGKHFHYVAINTAMHSSLRFLGATDVGKILNLFSQDMNIMDTQLPRMVNNMCFCLTNAIGQVIVIALSSAWLAISYPFFAGLLWVVQRVYLPTSKRLRILDLEAKTPLYTNFLDTIAGLPTIRAFGWFPNQLARNNALLDDSQRPSYLLAMVQQWLTLTMNIIVTIIAVLLVVLATQLGSNAGSVGAGLVTLITLGSTMTNIIMAYTGLETSLGAISRLKSFGEETELEDDKNDNVKPGEEWPVNGRVEMHGVQASYNGTDKVLRGVDLVIEAGEKVAICGRTGSGKSSILALLLRLIDPIPSTGPEFPPVLIDDLPLTSIDRPTLRERIISASQDQVFLPDGTSFRDNLDPWNVATDTECFTVLSDLGLFSVVEAKGGLGGPINGVEFSSGQKQLFSLARAVLRRRVKKRRTGVDGGLLLLDEITSSADAETERKVRRILDDEFSGYTVVIVTHHRDMAMGVDRVVVLDKGCVVEEGKPSDVIEKEGGWFRDLWASSV